RCLATTDQKIKDEARLFQDELNGVYRRRLERLRLLLGDEAYNMVLRCFTADVSITRKNRSTHAAPWLHGKTYEQTYRDRGPRAKQQRTRARFEALLSLCGGDK